MAEGIGTYIWRNEDGSIGALEQELEWSDEYDCWLSVDELGRDADDDNTQEEWRQIAAENPPTAEDIKRISVPEGATLIGAIEAEVDFGDPCARCGVETLDGRYCSYCYRLMREEEEEEMDRECECDCDCDCDCDCGIMDECEEGS